MPEFKLIDVDETPYFYAEGSCSMDPADIGKAMGTAFGDVWNHMQEGGVQTTGKALSVYYTFNPETMTFRSGFSVTAEAADKASGDVKYDVTPSGKVLHFQHVGPYSKLRDSYGLMMAHAEREGLKIGAPTWEVYVNDPAVTPEDELLTDVFVSLA